MYLLIAISFADGLVPLCDEELESTEDVNTKQEAPILAVESLGYTYSAGFWIITATIKNMYPRHLILS